MDKFTPWMALAGRVLLALMFVLAGLIVVAAAARKRS